MMTTAVIDTLQDLARNPRPRLEDSPSWRRIIRHLRTSGEYVATKMSGARPFQVRAGLFAMNHADSLVAQPTLAQRVATDLLTVLYNEN